MIIIHYTKTNNNWFGGFLQLEWLLQETRGVKHHAIREKRKGEKKKKCDEQEVC
jgi:hypothetical protein